MSLFCTNCGSTLEADDAFCPDCGVRVPDPAGDDDAVPTGDDTIVMPSAVDDMAHALEPSPLSNTTAQMPLVSAAEAARRYDAVPPEEVVGGSGGKAGSSHKGLIVGTAIVVAVVVAVGAALVFTGILPSLFNTVEEQKVAIVFETQGGSTIEAAQVEVGETLASPADPVRDGYSFGGWYADASFTTPVSFPLTPTEDMVLYAQWTPLTDSSNTSAGSSSKAYSTDDAALAALKAYLVSLEEANDVVSDFASDDFNTSYNKGLAKVSEAIEECDEAYDEVYNLLMDSSGMQWTVSTMTIPTTYIEQRDMLEEASDTLLTRLNAYSSALYVIQSMGSGATDKEIDAAIEDYLADGHNAYTTYQELVEQLEKDL